MSKWARVSWELETASNSEKLQNAPLPTSISQGTNSFSDLWSLQGSWFKQIQTIPPAFKHYTPRRAPANIANSELHHLATTSMRIITFVMCSWWIPPQTPEVFAVYPYRLTTSYSLSHSGKVLFYPRWWLPWPVTGKTYFYDGANEQ